MHAPEPIIELAQGHIAILIGRNWPAIVELLEESEEVTVSAKIVITERTPEKGEHADVDHRVKTTISFSKKVSDSTESALEDPSNAPLTCPHGKTLDVFCQECAEAEKAAQSVFVPPPVDPERHPETGDSAAEVRDAKAVIEDARKPIGTPVGAALDQAAVKTKAPPFALDLTKEDYTVVSLMKAVRIAAKAAGWGAPEISALNDILKKCAGVNSMIDTLRPFVISEEPPIDPDTHIIITTKEGDARVPLLEIVLPDGFPLEKSTGVFRQGAIRQDWPEIAIDTAVSEALRRARVILDEPEATEAATAYLRNFCVSK